MGSEAVRVFEEGRNSRIWFKEGIRGSEGRLLSAPKIVFEPVAALEEVSCLK